MGYVIMLDESPIFYRTKGQIIVTSSTTEAEYVAATSCSQDIVYYKQLLCELGYKDVKVILEQDNNGLIAHLKDPMAEGRTRHLDIKMKWCTQYISQESIEVRYCLTADMIADGRVLLNTDQRWLTRLRQVLKVIALKDH
jgi:hypothetical protein